MDSGKTDPTEVGRISYLRVFLCYCWCLSVGEVLSWLAQCLVLLKLAVELFTGTDNQWPNRPSQAEIGLSYCVILTGCSSWGRGWNEVHVPKMRQKWILAHLQWLDEKAENNGVKNMMRCREMNRDPSVWKVWLETHFSKNKFTRNNRKDQ